MPEDNLPKMDFNKGGENFKPLEMFPFDGEILAVYQGGLSDFDMLIKYKQNINEEWTRLRTPKHIHWAVDLLIKKYSGEHSLVEEFLDYLLEYWENIVPLRSDAERDTYLQNLKSGNINDEIERFKNLNNHGEYKVEFLITMAKLLMVQEKTNYEDAYMFKNLLEALRDGKDIFKTISIATHH